MRFRGEGMLTGAAADDLKISLTVMSIHPCFTVSQIIEKGAAT